jgi:hypothetical protein
MSDENAGNAEGAGIELLEEASEAVEGSTRFENKVFGFGYAEGDLGRLKRIVERLGATVVDIRNQTRSGHADWNVDKLRGTLKGRYFICSGFANLNDKGPPQVRDLDAGQAQIEPLLRRGPVILMCRCKEPERCHRTMVLEYLEARGFNVAGELPNVDIVEEAPLEVDEETTLPVVTLPQPWASLWVSPSGVKVSHSFATEIPPMVAVHSAASMTDEEKAVCGLPLLRDLLLLSGFRSYKALPLGRILGIVRLNGTLGMGEWKEVSQGNIEPPWENTLMDLTQDWVSVRGSLFTLQKPLPMRGRKGVWETQKLPVMSRVESPSMVGSKQATRETLGKDALDNLPVRRRTQIIQETRRDHPELKGTQAEKWIMRIAQARALEFVSGDSIDWK